MFTSIGPPGIKGDQGLVGMKGDQGAQGNFNKRVFLHESL